MYPRTCLPIKTRCLSLPLTQQYGLTAIDTNTVPVEKRQPDDMPDVRLRVFISTNTNTK